MVQSQSLKPEGVAEIPEIILPEFSHILLEGWDKTKSNSWGDRNFHFNDQQN